MGKEGKESFNLVTDFSMESQDIENAITDSTDNLEKFINDEFYVTLINRIKSEVKMAINEHTLLNEKTTNPLSDKFNIISNKDDNNAILINSLKSEIDFLRTEIQSKDKIIEIIIKYKHANNGTLTENNLELENIQRSKKHTLNKKHSVNKKNRYASLENYEGDDNLRNHHESVESSYEELLTKENNKSTKRNITILEDSLTKDMK